MKNLIFGIVSLGFATLAHPQAADMAYAGTDNVGSATALEANASYLGEVEIGELPTVVSGLQEEAANFDVSQSSKFRGKEDTFEFVFQHKKGFLLATFDRSGKIIRSQEKYRDVVFTKPVQKTIRSRFPGYTVVGNTYRVTFEAGQAAKKVYTVRIEKDGNRKRFKIDADGILL